jgi:lysophospholipase L1-like esterase
VLPRLNHASPRVAFLGDSITQGWDFPRVNFGIRGQTTAQMLARFPRQVAGHGFRQVVILGGTNDTLLGIDQVMTIANLSKMVDLARSAGVEPVLAEIPPIYYEDGKMLGQTQLLNARIRNLAAQKRVKLVDYYDALLGHPEVYSDGIHLKRRGYLRMEWALWHGDNVF